MTSHISALSKFFVPNFLRDRVSETKKVKKEEKESDEKEREKSATPPPPGTFPIQIPNKHAIEVLMSLQVSKQLSTVSVIISSFQSFPLTQSHNVQPEVCYIPYA